MSTFVYLNNCEVYFNSSNKTFCSWKHSISRLATCHITNPKQKLFRNLRISHIVCVFIRLLVRKHLNLGKCLKKRAFIYRMQYDLWNIRHYMEMGDMSVNPWIRNVIVLWWLFNIGRYMIMTRNFIILLWLIISIVILM